MQSSSPSTLFFGQLTLRYTEVESTNLIALQLLNQDQLPAEGTAIMAQKQTKGRGQRQQSWHAEPGKNLTVSYILYPKFLPLSKQFYLSMAIALGVSDFVAGISKLPVDIKWPNDILLKGKKIGGILIENTVSATYIASAVIGIGININQQEFDPIEAPNAASLFNFLNQAFDINECFKLLSESLEGRYLQLRRNEFLQLEQEYISKLYQFEKMCDYIYKGESIKAKITGITPTGKLRLIDDRKTLMEADLKELQFIFP